MKLIQSCNKHKLKENLPVRSCVKTFYCFNLDSLEISLISCGKAYEYLTYNLSATSCQEVRPGRAGEGERRVDAVLDRLLCVSGPCEGPEALPGITNCTAN